MVSRIPIFDDVLGKENVSVFSFSYWIRLSVFDDDVAVPVFRY